MRNYKLYNFASFLFSLSTLFFLKVNWFKNLYTNPSKPSSNLLDGVFVLFYSAGAIFIVFLIMLMVQLYSLKNNSLYFLPIITEILYLYILLVFPISNNFKYFITKLSVITNFYAIGIYLVGGGILISIFLKI